MERYSSRRGRLDRAFLQRRLRNARSYKRIAGYFRSSILDLVGEELTTVGEIRIVCNSDLDPADIKVAKAVRDSTLLRAWNESGAVIDGALHRERYQRLYELLDSGRVQIRVVPKDRLFLHGKAGIIEDADGIKRAFVGSVNETMSAFSSSYEIIWEDDSPEAVAWVDEEFEALWETAVDLPNVVIQEIKRIAERVEVSLGTVEDEDLPGAVLAESPMYRNGYQLRPWQQRFVAEFQKRRSRDGTVRMLLADEVGLGKTLSMATAALLANLQGDGPVLILCPKALIWQWQTELWDNLNTPSAVWDSQRKAWVDHTGHRMNTSGPEGVRACPYQIGIVSTGLITQGTTEAEVLLARRYGTVILDEAHHARTKHTLGSSEPTNLMQFMCRMGHQTRHMLLGTATPIQTSTDDLWDLLTILNEGTDTVLGSEMSVWRRDPDTALRIIKGESTIDDPRDVWDLLRNPLPSDDNHPNRHVIYHLRRKEAALADGQTQCGFPYSELNSDTQQDLQRVCKSDYFQFENPVARHVALRRRQDMEKRGLLPSIEVRAHPEPDRLYRADDRFIGTAVSTPGEFRTAYELTKTYAKLRAKRAGRSAGLMQSLMLQRVCSSFESGRQTAQRLLDGESGDTVFEDSDLGMSDEERECLVDLKHTLETIRDRDPKLAVVSTFLTQERIGGKSWLEHGCIIFSQYYDTVRWVAEQLATQLPNEHIAVYAGTGRSEILTDGHRVSTKREEIKRAIRDREVRLVVATDAAGEGLNLQTLGTLINIDLPWNPARLEQRIGRIQRLGQTRDVVDMLNLVYHRTQDETVYRVISERMKDRYDIFGGLPDLIDDDWIAGEKELRERCDIYLNLRRSASPSFKAFENPQLDVDDLRWEQCARVLSPDAIREQMTQPW